MVKWFVRLDPPEMRVRDYPWGVWLNGFRDSTHESKWLAEQRRDELNRREKMIAKADLIVGATYKGHCRNAQKAMWNGKKFEYIRRKFAFEYLETICHPDDDQEFDVFYPYELLEEVPMLTN